MIPVLRSACVPCLEVGQLLASGDAVVIDLRSPAEHAADHVPGAVNAPLFDDVERALIGTLYRRRSPEAAFDEARRLARSRIRALVETIAAAAGEPCALDGLEERLSRMTEGGIAALEGTLESVPVTDLPARPLVLHCWRGGLRSKSVVAFLRALGLERAVGLSGGYRSYRRLVVQALAAWESPPVFVLRGLTGVGKTLVLRELERIRPGWTLDLEAAAGHRSSILGMVGLAPVGQKRFESRLHARLRGGFPGRIVLEGESRKVGDAILPERLWQALEGGTAIELVAPEERRVDVLVEDYLGRAGNRAELRARLPFIEQRLGPRKWPGRLVALLDAGQDRELAALLLELYYDPLYRHSEKTKCYAVRIDATDVARAAEAVAAFVESRSRP